eukprot:TRINITY_DN10536_c0_g2_i3.p1 TRINITY_DN10536_c0_g2~~TRINITY_DN10536_c0_g2_i3.p1  ORF type:complete len:369 (+),score=96.20 TRINITY_DN10536_c0_g2_i3:155-1261(+)
MDSTVPNQANPNATGSSQGANTKEKPTEEPASEELKKTIDAEVALPAEEQKPSETLVEETQRMEQVTYREESGKYECSLLLKSGLVRVYMKKNMEPEFWERTFSFADATKENELWGSLLNVDLLYTFIVSAFNNSAVSIITSNETELTLEFLYQMGFTKIKLPLKIQKGKMDTEAILAEYGKIIKQLYEEREELKEVAQSLHEELRVVKEEHRIGDKLILCQKTSGTQISTYNSTFNDMPGIKEGELVMKRKGKVHWSLHMNGLWSNAAGGYMAGFRVELVDANAGAKRFWPGEKGCCYRVFSSCGGGLSFPFHYSDIASLDEGTYKVKLQWAYSSNSSSYIMYYNPGYGDLKLIATLCCLQVSLCLV